MTDNKKNALESSMKIATKSSIKSILLFTALFSIYSASASLDEVATSQEFLSKYTHALAQPHDQLTREKLLAQISADIARHITSVFSATHEYTKSQISALKGKGINELDLMETILSTADYYTMLEFDIIRSVYIVRILQKLACDYKILRAQHDFSQALSFAVQIEQINQLMLAMQPDLKIKAAFALHGDLPINKLPSLSRAWDECCVM